MRKCPLRRPEISLDRGRLITAMLECFCASVLLVSSKAEAATVDMSFPTFISAQQGGIIPNYDVNSDDYLDSIVLETIYEDEFNNFLRSIIATRLGNGGTSYGETTRDTVLSYEIDSWLSLESTEDLNSDGYLDLILRQSRVSANQLVSNLARTIHERLVPSEFSGDRVHLAVGSLHRSFSPSSLSLGCRRGQGSSPARRADPSLRLLQREDDFL